MYFALQSILSKFLDELEFAAGIERAIALGGLGRVTHDLFENRKVIHKPAPSLGCDPAGCEGLIADKPLFKFDEPRLLQHLQMTAEIAISQAAELLQIAKGQALWLRDERGKDAKPCLFVDHAVQTLI